MSIVLKINTGLKSRRAQTVLEYSMIVVITVGVLIIMHNYMNRALQGRLKEEIDKAGPTSGDYTTDAGHGSAHKSRMSFIWENKKGHQITFTSASRGDSFTINAAAELPYPPRPPCFGAECALRDVEGDILTSALGEAAIATILGNEPGIGDGGWGAELGLAEAEELQVLAERVEGEDTDGDGAGDRGDVRQFEFATSIDAGTDIVDPADIDSDPDPDYVGPGGRQDYSQSSYAPTVNTLTSETISSGAAPGWAVEILTQ